MNQKESNTQKDEEYSKNSKKIKPLIAGVLLITSGIIGLVMSGPLLIVDDDLIQDMRENNMIFNESFQNVTASQIKQSFMMVGAIGIIFSIFGFIGGILSFLRKKWIVTLVLSIISIFSVLLLILPGIFSAIAVIIIFMSKNDFQQKSNKE